MSWGWLVALLLIAWVNDWPWLTAMLGLSWILSLGHWPTSPLVPVLELVGVLGLESILAVLLPTRRWHREWRVLTLEGVVLGALAMLWGAVAALTVFQASLGADAGHRIENLLGSLQRIAWLRGIRLAAGAVFIVLYSHGI